MGIVLFRIDDRLIHGQVVEGWFHYLRPDLVVVADDATAANEFQRSVMEMVVPYGIRTEIVPVREAVQRWRAGAYAPRRGILLFRGPGAVLTALGMGLSVESLNLGGLHSEGPTTFLGRGVNASEGDIRDLRLLLGRGVRIEVQPVPAESPVDIRTLMSPYPPVDRQG